MFVHDSVLEWDDHSGKSHHDPAFSCLDGAVAAEQAPVSKLRGELQQTTWLTKGLGGWESPLEWSVNEKEHLDLTRAFAVVAQHPH